MKKLRIISIIVIIIIAIVWNKQIIDSKQEISSLELVKVMGMDYVYMEDKDYSEENSLNNINLGENTEGKKNSKNMESQISLLINSNLHSTPQVGKEVTNNQKGEVFSFRGITFNSALGKTQTYMQKSIPGSHIQYLILGNDMTSIGVSKAVDFISRSSETRLNARVYAVEDKTAKEFLECVIQDSIEVDHKLSSMEQKTEFPRQYLPVEVMDILEAEEKEEAYVIPRLKIAKEKESINDVKLNKDDKLQENSNYFDFSGYRVMFKNKKIVDLDLRQSLVYNMLINKSKGIIIDIVQGNDTVSFGVINSSCKYEFEFDENNIPIKVNIKINVESNIDEDDTSEDIFDIDVIEKYEKKQEKILKSKLKEVIKIYKDNKVDFIKLEEKFKIRYPYKYRKIEKKFDEIIDNMEIELKVNCNIIRTYDVIMTNKN